MAGVTMTTFTVPTEFLVICKEEVIRSGLVSLPLKARFAESRGMAIEQVDAWMVATRKAFEAAVGAAQAA